MTDLQLLVRSINIRLQNLYTTFCCKVNTCLGISSTGDSSLVLNQQGNWVLGSRIRTTSGTYVDSHNSQTYTLDETPDGVLLFVFRDYALSPGPLYQRLYLTIPPAYSIVGNVITFEDLLVSGETFYIYYTY